MAKTDAWWETSIMVTAMVSQCSMQGCLGVIIMHCYDNVGSKHNLANHCRNKFHYHCSYAFPVQFKITEVCGDWFLNEWLPGDRCVFVILGCFPLTTKCICRMFFFFLVLTQMNICRQDPKEEGANGRNASSPFLLCLFIFFLFFPPCGLQRH